MSKIEIISRLCISVLVSIFILDACNSKAGKTDILSSEIFNLKSDTDIIGAQFKESNINIDQNIIWNDSKFKNAYLINDSMYFDFESVKPFFDLSKMNNRFSIHLDTNYIKNVFSLYKLPYRGQNRLVTKN